MTSALPTDLYLSVVRVAATMSVHMEGDKPDSSELFSLVLRAAHDTNVVLTTGQRLSEVDVHFTLSTKWRTAQELDRSLTIDDVGFLAHAHAQGERGEPFVHGGSLLTSTTVVASLLSAGMNRKLRLVLPTVPFESSKAAPYVWGINRSNMLRISHVEVSAFRSEATPSDG